MDWKRLFDSLGLNGTWWQWRILLLQRRWKNFLHSLRQKKQVVTYRHKFCRQCGLLMDGKDDFCPKCGVRAQNWRVQAIQRALGLATPSWPLAVTVLLGVNLFSYLALVLLSDETQIWWLPHQVLLKTGALAPKLVLRGEWWRLLTCGYLHFGLLHIIFNMVALSQVGPLLEKEIATSRFFLLYTLALLGGAGADMLFYTGTPVVVAGASGALFGLIGFGITYCHFYGGTLGRQQRNFFLHWALYGFIFGFLVGADNVAHGGGFVVGVVAGIVIERIKRAERNIAFGWQVAAFMMLALTLAAFVSMIKTLE